MAAIRDFVSAMTCTVGPNNRAPTAMDAFPSKQVFVSSAEENQKLISKLDQTLSKIFDDDSSALPVLTAGICLIAYPIVIKFLFLMIQ